MVDGGTFGIDQLSSGGFDVFRFVEGYRIFISDASIGIRTIDLITTNSSNPQWGAIYTSDLTSDPAFTGQLSENVVFTGLNYVTSNATEYSETWQLIVITENSNAFLISWTINTTVTTPFISVYQGFLNFRGYTNLAIFDFDVNEYLDTFIAVVAEDPTSQARYVLIYNTTANYSNTGAAGVIQYSTVLGTAPYATASPYANALELWGNPLESPAFKLWTPQVNSTWGAIAEYDLREGLTFLITGNLTSTYMNLTAVNDQGVSSVSFALGNAPPSNNDGGSSSVLWIVFLVIILVLVVILMVVAVKKCRPQEVTDASIDTEGAKTGLIMNQA